MLGQLPQVGVKLNELRVLLVVVEGQTGHSVARLQTVRVGEVVHQQDLLEIVALDDPQVLDEDVGLYLDAVLSTQDH